jgi:hypothetical protein
VTYAPASGFTGTDTFTFKVNDGTEESNLATVTITVSDHTTFTLTVVSAGSGSGTVGGGGTFEVNTIVTPTAVADAGSHFAGWTPAFCDSPFPLTSDTACTASFVSDLAVTADGDVAPLGNRDGVVTVLDSQLVLKFALGIERPSADDIIHADVAPLDASGRPNPDGVINAGDALVILRKAMGLVNW